MYIVNKTTAPINISFSQKYQAFILTTSQQLYNTCKGSLWEHRERKANN